MENTFETGAVPVITDATLSEMPGVVATELYCPKCTGPMLRCYIGHVGIYGWWLERVSRPAGPLGPPRTSSSDLAAQTCTRCGYTEFYAADPQGLLMEDAGN